MVNSSNHKDLFLPFSFFFFLFLVGGQASFMLLVVPLACRPEKTMGAIENCFPLLLLLATLLDFDKKSYYVFNNHARPPVSMATVVSTTAS